MAVELSELLLVAEAGGIPQGSPPHQAGEDRATAREPGGRRDGGAEAPAQDEEERVQAEEGRGQEVHKE